MNTADWIALAIIALALICAVIYIIRHKGHSCGGSCGNCPYADGCSKKDMGDKNGDGE